MDVNRTHRCCCIITTKDGASELKCGNTTSSDQPFCEACEDRHANWVDEGSSLIVSARLP